MPLLMSEAYSVNEIMNIPSRKPLSYKLSLEVNLLTSLFTPYFFMGSP